MNDMKKGYRNVFAELGKTESEISDRLKQIVDEFFCSEDRVYFTSGKEPVRVQGAYVFSGEKKKVASFLASQGQAPDPWL